jgi:hypothetical protein
MSYVALDYVFNGEAPPFFRWVLLLGDGRDDDDDDDGCACKSGEEKFNTQSCLKKLL